MDKKQKEEVFLKMQYLIKKKHFKKNEDSIMVLKDGTEVKISYAEDY